MIRRKTPKICRVIEEVLSGLFQPSTKLDLRFGLAKPKQCHKPIMTEVTITNAQKIKATLAPVTQSGKPAKLDGKPTWSVVDGDGTVSVSDDGLSADLVSGDNPGVTNYLVEADADLGEGVETISSAIVLTVVGEKASSLGITLGQPEDK